VYGTGELGLAAVSDVSFVVGRGEFVALMGPSGSGKSTLMNILGCLDRPTSGQYLLDGRDVSTLSQDQLADLRGKFIGFVFQGFNLLPRTSALDNVELPLVYTAVGETERKRRSQAALELVGLGGRARHWPGELSGGEQQRVAIARALVNDPILILADEPTGNLDSRSGAEIMSVFARLNAERKITILVVTHDALIAGWANRLVSFQDGKMVSDQLTPHSSRVAAGV
jgi:putative ABC transport system ATP-binding protein